MPPTPLEALLVQRIRAEGPIPVSRYMAEALGHPEYGYYRHRDPFGSAGDFTTAPEVSQMFGELIGLWCAVVWQMMGSPSWVVLAELGPGRGTLMADVLRAAATLPAFAAAVEVHLVETSPSLRNRQAQVLAGANVHWAERFEDLPPGPLLLVANELFDALPIRQLEKRGGAWHERMVGLGEGGGLDFALGPVVEAPPLAPSVLGAADGAVAEIGEEGRRLAAAIGRRVAGEAGAALIVDYGYAFSAAGDSLQALKRHRFHPVLADAGEADITAHVDFQALAEAAAPAAAWGPVPQGRFLTRLGIEERATLLLRGAQPKAAGDIVGQLRRLIDPGEMGTLFKALALATPGLPALPGFEP
jgi:NADH dehydrogenase [ubiquinone] 1 alpha subcomplex assembly factor 7